jgi:hypothetical protein
MQRQEAPAHDLVFSAWWVCVVRSSVRCVCSPVEDNDREGRAVRAELKCSAHTWVPPPLRSALSEPERDIPSAAVVAPKCVRCIHIVCATCKSTQCTRTHCTPA